MRRTLLLTTVLLLPLTLSACSSDGDVEAAREEAASLEPETPEKTDEELYAEAMAELEDGSYSKAITLFEEIERQYPYSPWATEGQVMAAFASYRDEEYDDAIARLERFVKVHPGNKDAPYAYYLIALSYYEQISDVGRDQGMTRAALISLQEVARRFPDSEYAQDAKIKTDLVRDHLAGKEMEVGRFYLKRGDQVAAINRFHNVIKQYQTTTHVPEALYRLVEAYLTLGVREEARRNAAVLGHNFPGSDWYAMAYDLLEGDTGGPVPGDAPEGEADNEEGGLLRDIQSLIQ